MDNYDRIPPYCSAAVPRKTSVYLLFEASEDVREIMENNDRIASILQLLILRNVLRKTSVYLLFEGRRSRNYGIKIRITRIP